MGRPRIEDKMKFIQLDIQDTDTYAKVLLEPDGDKIFAIYVQMMAYASIIQKAILADQRPSGKVIPMGPAMLAELLPMKHRSATEIEHALAVLCEHGLAQIITPPETDFREVIHMVMMDEPLEKFLDEVEERRKGREKKAAQRLGKKQEALPEPEEKGKKKASKTAEYEAEFEEMWKDYPKKIGKAGAKKAYVKARKDGVSSDKIRAAMDDYIAYTKREKKEKQFIKQGDTFFRGKPWEDDYSTAGSDQADGQNGGQNGGFSWF